MHLYCRKGEAYSKRIIYTRNDNMIGHIYLELSNTVFVSFYQYTNQNIGEKISNVYLVENRLLENVNHVTKYLVMPTN